MSVSNLATENKTFDLTITHSFDAPREDVFKAWTKSRHLVNWWAGGDVAMTAHKMDIHPGGAFHCDFKEAGVTLFYSQGVYQELIEPSHLAFTHSWNIGGDLTPDTHVAVELTEENGKTNMVFYQSGFTDTESREKHEQGWNKCFSKLDKYLKENSDF